jgi:starch synthase
MRILQVASEVALIAKVGGLGDVLTGLSRELHQQGSHPLLILPRYGCISYDHLHSTGEKERFRTTFQGVVHKVTVEFFLLQNEIPVALLDTEDKKWQSCEAIYGQPDDVAAFIFFNKACFDWLQSTERQFDVIHLHDWQAAYLSPLLKYAWKGELPAPKTVLSLHNIEYQGKCSFEEVLIGHPEILKLSPPDLFRDPWDDCVNLLKAAILSADVLVAVSKTYALEILTPEGGKGLDKVLEQRKKDLHGIVNGVDTVYWNPVDDPFLPEKYSFKDDKKKILHAKREAKKTLFEILAIDSSFLDLPLVGAVSRLVPQKGLSFLHHILESLETFDCTGVLLGSTYDDAIHEKFHLLDKKLLQKRRGRVLLQTSESIAHLIYAASDMFLVPSLFEPCGLTQLIALHYGSIPIVRKTGGLSDTVIDCQEGEPESKRNGFVFETPDVSSVHSATERALYMYRDFRENWEKLILFGMKLDVGWALPAKKYIRIYATLV